MGIIDRFLGKWASRKFIVFSIATLLAIFGSLTSGDWTYIAVAYIGSQALVDTMNKYKR
jgi:hypothetical protein